MATSKKKSKTLPQAALPLSEAEQEFNRVIFQLFGNYHLKEVKAYLWNWLQVALAKENSTYDTGKERSNLLFFYENLVELFEAFWLINQKINKEPWSHLIRPYLLQSPVYFIFLID